MDNDGNAKSKLPMTSLMITAITTTAMMITMMTSITITSMWPKDARDDQ